MSTELLKRIWMFVVLTPAFFAARAQDSPLVPQPKTEMEAVQASEPALQASLSEEKSSLPWQRLEARGITPQVTLLVDWSKNFRGGACSRGSVARQLFKSSLTLDTEKSLGWKGGTGFASLYYHTGKHGGEYAGDAQGFSNIDAPPRTYLYELWMQQELLGGRLRFKAGKVDSNTEFAVVDNGGDFLNSSMGYSPTIIGFATYPQPRPSLNVSYQARNRYYAKAGLYDSAGVGAMPVAEVGRRWAMTSSELEGKLGFGYWRQTGRMECFDGDDLEGTGGFFLVSEQEMWRSHRSSPSPATSGAQETPQSNMAVFFQYGSANADVSPFSKHVGGGFVWRGALPKRRSDVVGVGATWASLHDEPEATTSEPAELVLEAFYKIRVTSFLSIAPDVQFIHSPGLLSSQRDCLVATPRVTISF